MIKSFSKLFLASFLIILSCMGLARFAFGMVLPNMQSDLHISTTVAGLIGSANFAGYFVGIIFASKIYSHFRTTPLISICLFLQGLTMILMALADNYFIICILYFLTGFLAAILNIAIIVYLSHAIPNKIRGKALGIAVSGNGVGIIFSGLLVPYLEQFYQTNSWRVSWIVFSLIIIVISFSIKYLLTYDVDHSVKSDVKFYSYIKNKNFWKIGSLYFFFGISYVVYVTFFVSAAIDKWNLSSQISGMFWSTFGFICIFGGFLFGIIADKYGTFKTLILVFGFQAFSIFILIFNTPSFALFVSVFFFAISVWSVPTMITMLCTEFFGLKKTAQVFSLVTLLFAIGQIIGPLAAGYIHDTFKSYDYVFFMTFVLSFFGFISSIIFSYKKITI
ncbi:YbfB/YjiJ family MFS transporter [Arcobacter sp.]|uniref:YbfB/YjiJ family MFS transporter n=1 Tax=unclassified Arcobacter TaxID=2593671 RepID=UPI003B00D128